MHLLSLFQFSKVCSIYHKQIIYIKKHSGGRQENNLYFKGSLNKNLGTENSLLTHIVEGTVGDTCCTAAGSTGCTLGMVVVVVGAAGEVVDQEMRLPRHR